MRDAAGFIRRHTESRATPLPSALTEVRAHGTYHPHDTEARVEVADDVTLEPNRDWVRQIRIDPARDSRLTLELRCGTTTVDFYDALVR